ncbi:hypothetical protein PSEMO_48710 [Pseudomonas putida]|uniref:Uncharacterized protein n=1 Tax=Pseudomonas putida TaxID=303 RepID=A0A1Q9QZ70_PSEPU|nr:hypothetical protein PSEMO_48710 [Pseudomonas putida]
MGMVELSQADINLSFARASSLASQLPQVSRAPLNLWELACQR